MCIRDSDGLALLQGSTLVPNGVLQLDAHVEWGAFRDPVHVPVDQPDDLEAVLVLDVRDDTEQARVELRDHVRVHLAALTLERPVDIDEPLASSLVVQLREKHIPRLGCDRSPLMADANDQVFNVGLSEHILQLELNRPLPATELNDICLLDKLLDLHVLRGELAGQWRATTGAGASRNSRLEDLPLTLLGEVRDALDLLQLGSELIAAACLELSELGVKPVDEVLGGSINRCMLLIEIIGDRVDASLTVFRNAAC